MSTLGLSIDRNAGRLGARKGRQGFRSIEDVESLIRAPAPESRFSGKMIGAILLGIALGALGAALSGSNMLSLLH